MTFPPLPPAEAGTRLSDPGGMQGWVDLVEAHRAAIEQDAVDSNELEEKYNSLNIETCCG